MRLICKIKENDRRGVSNHDKCPQNTSRRRENPSLHAECGSTRRDWMKSGSHSWMRKPCCTWNPRRQCGATWDVAWGALGGREEMLIHWHWWQNRPQLREGSHRWFTLHMEESHNHLETNAPMTQTHTQAQMQLSSWCQSRQIWDCQSLEMPNIPRQPVDWCPPWMFDWPQQGLLRVLCPWHELSVESDHQWFQHQLCQWK